MTSKTQTYRPNIAKRHTCQDVLRPGSADMRKDVLRPGHGDVHRSVLLGAARACLSILLAALLAFIQPVLPGALRLDPIRTTEAQALEGTTNYSDMFHLSQRRGSPGYISGSTLGTVSTYSRDGYVYDSQRGAWMSSAAFTSNQPVSLLHDWTIECVVDKPAISINTSLHSEVFYQYVFGLFKNNDAESLSGHAIFMVDRYTASGGYETFLSDRYVENSLAAGTISNTNMSGSPTRSNVTISYSYAANSLTLKYGSYSKTMSSVRSSFPSQAYLGMWGTFNWKNKNGSTTSTQAPSGAYLDVTFNSMSMPHLEPSIESLSVYPESGSTPYGKDDMLPDGTVVRVECTVKNKYSNPGSEQYPVYLKTVNDAAHPTQGVAPFIDSTHPLTVKQGSSVISSTTSANANTVLGANGTPITLVGSNEYTVTYYAKINQASGEAVKLSQCLGENSFHGTYYATTELFSEKALVEGPDAASGVNYSRVPSANANGWNAGPVDIEFYADDTFDEFDIKDDAGELVKTLTADDAKWGVAGDTDGVPLTYQGRNTDIGVKSTAKPDVIRIDSLAPTLGYDKASNTLSASDVSADDARATSGIWKIVRVDSQDIAASPSDVRQGVVYKGTNGEWASEATLPNPYPGTYVAIDAAGNVSGEVEVASLGLPSVARPASGGSDSGDGSGDGYAGPVFTGSVPTGEVTVDENGLNHRVIQENVFEVVDGSMDRGDLPFGGTLDMDVARQLIGNNYSFSSDADGDSSIDVTVELIDARTGKPVDAIDTSKTGEYIVRATATDAQGNTTTAEVACRFANKDDLPQITPKPGAPNPDDPFGELVVDGDNSDDAPAPLEVRDVQLDEETGKVTGTVEASLYVPRSDTVATPGDVATLISNRYSVDSLIGAGNDSTIKRGEVVLKDSNGNIIEGIDLSKTGTWTATQTFTDNLGNETTLRVTITNKKKGSGSANLPADTDTPSINVTPSTDVRLDPESVGTVKDEPYFEHDPDKPLNVLDVLQVRPEDAEDWSAITGSGNGSGDGGGDGSNGGESSDGSGDGNNGSGDDGTGNGPGNGAGTNPGGTTSQLPDNVKVTVTDETGAQVDETNIKDPGTYTVTVSVKDPDTGEFIVIETLTFHVVDTSITDTDYIYKDVPKDHWGHGYIFDIGPTVINGAFNPSDVALGYMAGYAGTTDFGPHNGIIRGDAAIVIWRMAGCPDIEGDVNDPGAQRLLSLANTYYTGFSDCDANPTMYYNKAIRWCAANGIVEGYGDTGEYRPQNQITREEFASIIARYAAFKGKDVASASADLTQYPDHECISDWAIDNIKYVTHNGIMTGKGTDEGTADEAVGILDPQAHVTRAEVAKMTYMEQPSRL